MKSAARHTPELTGSEPAEPLRVLHAKQRVYRLSALILFVGGSVPMIAIVAGDSPDARLAMLIDIPTLLNALVVYFALGKLAWLPIVERLMLGGLLAFLLAWDIVNIALRRVPSAGDVVSNASIFLLACILVCLMVSMRHQRRWLLALFGTHFTLTWINLLRVPWDQRLHITQFMLDVITLVSLLLLSMIGLYQQMLKTAEGEAQEMRSLAHTDSLTQLPNRRAMYAALEAHPAAAILLIDVDDFKVVNDSWGHPYGDDLLIQIAERLTDQVGERGIVGRWGGEEFLVVLPDTDLSAAHALAEAARAAVERLPGANTTLSVGVAVPDPPESFARLLSRADEQLYLAKSLGKNQVRPQLADLPVNSTIDP